MKIALACDHGGLNLKNEVIKYLESHGYEYKDFETYTKDSCDYPDYALPAAEECLLAPAAAVVPLQNLALECALRLGRDPDRPRNLAKSVTVI